MRNLSNNLCFTRTESFLCAFPEKWRREVSQLTRNEYMALPYEAKEKLLFSEFQTGRELIQGTPAIVSRHCSVLGSRLEMLTL